MFSGEVAKFISNILELPSGVVQNLDITREVPLSVHFAELIERFIRNVGNVQLVIAFSISRECI